METLRVIFSFFPIIILVFILLISLRRDRKRIKELKGRCLACKEYWDRELDE